jgi:hypothetical protein
MKRFAISFWVFVLAVLLTAGISYADQSYIANITTNQPIISTDGVGAGAGSDVSVVEYGADLVHKTVFTLDEQAIALADEAATVAYAGLKIYDFPAGAVLILGSTADLALTKSSAGVNDDWDGDFGLGTATAGNDASLTNTEDDVLPTTATPQATSGETTATGQSTADENVVHDGTTTAKDLYLNFLVDDADQDVTGTACNLIADGTITVYWVNLGDY